MHMGFWTRIGTILNVVHTVAMRTLHLDSNSDRLADKPKKVKIRLNFHINYRSH